MKDEGIFKEKISETDRQITIFEFRKIKCTKFGGMENNCYLCTANRQTDN